MYTKHLFNKTHIKVLSSLYAFLHCFNNSYSCTLTRMISAIIGLLVSCDY